MTAIILATVAAATFNWQQTATTLALRNGDQVVWQLVYDPAQPKTYFHPLATVDGEVLTALSPADHPWHRGLWWSWKYINKLNYWEEDETTGKSQGVNELLSATAKPGNNFSATAELKFAYHPPGQPPVMTETRTLKVSKPDAAGAYLIDWTAVFTVGNAPVLLDRTPPKKTSGGYTGLSLRFPPGIKDWKFTTSTGKTGATEGNGKPARWVDFTGPHAGIAVFDHPANLRHPSLWYLNEKLPYFSPALLYADPLELKPHKTLTLRYRIMVHPGQLTQKELDAAWQLFTK